MILLGSQTVVRHRRHGTGRRQFHRHAARTRRREKPLFPWTGESFSGSFAAGWRACGWVSGEGVAEVRFKERTTLVER